MTIYGIKFIASPTKNTSFASEKNAESRFYKDKKLNDPLNLNSKLLL